MNRMVVKVKAMFSHQVELNSRLHQQLRTDEVTGLSNRRDFDERLRSYMKSERTGDGGSLMLIQVSNLNRINLEKGRAAGDEYLCAIAQGISARLETYEDALLSRHSGCDFAVFIPAIAPEESQELMQTLHSELQATEWSGELMQPIYIGMVYATDLHQQLKERQFSLLAVADSAINQARNEQASGCHWQLLDQHTDEKIMTYLDAYS